MGTVVFLDAVFKVYSPPATPRARRRHLEVSSLQYDADSPVLAVEPSRPTWLGRDKLTHPRRPPWPTTDATEIDTTGRSVEDIVVEVMALGPPPHRD